MCDCSNKRDIIFIIIIITFLLFLIIDPYYTPTTITNRQHNKQQKQTDNIGPQQHYTRVLGNRRDCLRECPTERPTMALTDSNTPHRAPGVARKQHYTRVPGNRRG